MKNKFLKIAGVAVLATTLAACGKKVTEEDYRKWAADNGYMLGLDHKTTATEQGKGINSGAFEWTDKLKQQTVLEFLKGDQIQDHEGNPMGYNYRSMFSIATAVPELVNGKTEIKVSNTNVEFTLNPNNFELYGVSEAGTGKTLDFLVNENVSLTWIRQLNASDADYPTGFAGEADYYHSYGVQFNGKVRVLTVDDSSELKLRVMGTYLPTLGSYRAMWASLPNDAAKLAVADNMIKGASVYYVVPESIVITAAYDSISTSSLQKIESNNRAAAEKAAKCYVYSTNTDNFKFIRSSFWTTKIAAKAAALTADAANNYAKINAAYGSWDVRKVAAKDLTIGETTVKAGTVLTDAQLTGLTAADYKEVRNWPRVFAMEATNSCGMMSQQVLKNFTPIA